MSLQGITGLGGGVSKSTIQGGGIEEIGPIEVNGYYPLYITEGGAEDAGNGTVIEYVLNDETYFMPQSGLVKWTGDYTLDGDTPQEFGGYYPVYKSHLKAQTISYTDDPSLVENDDDSGVLTVESDGQTFFYPTAFSGQKWDGDYGQDSFVESIRQSQQGIYSNERFHGRDGLAVVKNSSGTFYAIAASEGFDRDPEELYSYGDDTSLKQNSSSSGSYLQVNDMEYQYVNPRDWGGVVNLYDENQNLVHTFVDPDREASDNLLDQTGTKSVFQQGVKFGHSIAIGEGIIAISSIKQRRRYIKDQSLYTIPIKSKERFDAYNGSSSSAPLETSGVVHIFDINTYQHLYSLVDKFTEVGDSPGLDGTFVDQFFYNRDDVIFRPFGGGAESDIKTNHVSRIHEYGAIHYGSGLVIDNGRLVVGASNAHVPLNANYAYDHDTVEAIADKSAVGVQRGAIFIYDLTKSTPAEIQDSEVAILRPAHTHFQPTFGVERAMTIAGGSLIVGDAGFDVEYYSRGTYNLNSYDQYMGRGKVFVYDLTTGKLKNTIEPWEQEENFILDNPNFATVSTNDMNFYNGTTRGVAYDGIAAGFNITTAGNYIVVGLRSGHDVDADTGHLAEKHRMLGAAALYDLDGNYVKTIRRLRKGDFDYNVAPNYYTQGPDSGEAFDWDFHSTASHQQNYPSPFGASSVTAYGDYVMFGCPEFPLHAKVEGGEVDYDSDHEYGERSFPAGAVEIYRISTGAYVGTLHADVATAEEGFGARIFASDEKLFVSVENGQVSSYRNTTAPNVLDVGSNVFVYDLKNEGLSELGPLSLNGIYPLYNTEMHAKAASPSSTATKVDISPNISSGSANDTLNVVIPDGHYTDDTKLSVVILDFERSGDVNKFEVTEGTGASVIVFHTDNDNLIGGPVSKNGSGEYVTMRRYVIIKHNGYSAASFSIKLKELNWKLSSVNYNLYGDYDSTANGSPIGTGSLGTGGTGEVSVINSDGTVKYGAQTYYKPTVQAGDPTLTMWDGDYTESSETGPFAVSATEDGITKNFYPLYTTERAAYRDSVVENRYTSDTFVVKVESTDSGNKYFLNPDDITGADQSLGVNIKRDIRLERGKRYKFDQSHSSNTNHPLRICTSLDGYEYQTNVTYSGTPGELNAYTEITIPADCPDNLYYKCGNHAGMGSYIKVVNQELISADKKVLNGITYFAPKNVTYFDDWVSVAEQDIATGVNGYFPLYKTKAGALAASDAGQQPKLVEILGSSTRYYIPRGTGLQIFNGTLGYRNYQDWSSAATKYTASSATNFWESTQESNIRGTYEKSPTQHHWLIYNTDFFGVKTAINSKYIVLAEGQRNDTSISNEHPNGMVVFYDKETKAYLGHIHPSDSFDNLYLSSTRGNRYYQFGKSIAMNEKWLAVGGPGFPFWEIDGRNNTGNNNIGDAGYRDYGAVVVYDITKPTLAEIEASAIRISPPRTFNGHASNTSGRKVEFGYSVALDGDNLYVGSPKAAGHHAVDSTFYGYRPSQYGSVSVYTLTDDTSTFVQNQGYGGGSSNFTTEGYVTVTGVNIQVKNAMRAGQNITGLNDTGNKYYYSDSPNNGGAAIWERNLVVPYWSERHNIEMASETANLVWMKTSDHLFEDSLYGRNIAIGDNYIAVYAVGNQDYSKVAIFNKSGKYLHTLSSRQTPNSDTYFGEHMQWYGDILFIGSRTNDRYGYPDHTTVAPYLNERGAIYIYDYGKSENPAGDEIILRHSHKDDTALRHIHPDDRSYGGPVQAMFGQQFAVDSGHLYVSVSSLRNTTLIYKLSDILGHTGPLYTDSFIAFDWDAKEGTTPTGVSHPHPITTNNGSMVIIYPNIDTTTEHIYMFDTKLKDEDYILNVGGYYPVWEFKHLADAESSDGNSTAYTINDKTYYQPNAWSSTTWQGDYVVGAEGSTHIDGHYPVYRSILDAQAADPLGEATPLLASDGLTYYKIPNYRATSWDGDYDPLTSETGPLSIVNTYPLYLTEMGAIDASGDGTASIVDVGGTLYFYPGGVFGSNNGTYGFDLSLATDDSWGYVTPMTEDANGTQALAVSNMSSDGFGKSVAANDTYLAVSSPGEDHLPDGTTDSTSSAAGLVRVFKIDHEHNQGNTSIETQIACLHCTQDNSGATPTFGDNQLYITEDNFLYAPVWLGGGITSNNPNNYGHCVVEFDLNSEDQATIQASERFYQLESSHPIVQQKNSVYHNFTYNTGLGTRGDTSYDPVWNICSNSKYLFMGAPRAGSSYQGGVTVWDRTTKELVEFLTPTTPTSSGYVGQGVTCNERYVVASSSRTNTFVWDAQTLELVSSTNKMFTGGSATGGKLGGGFTYMTFDGPYFYFGFPTQTNDTYMYRYTMDDLADLGMATPDKSYHLQSMPGWSGWNHTQWPPKTFVHDGLLVMGSHNGNYAPVNQIAIMPVSGEVENMVVVKYPGEYTSNQFGHNTTAISRNKIFVGDNTDYFAGPESNTLSGNVYTYNISDLSLENPVDENGIYPVFKVPHAADANSTDGASFKEIINNKVYYRPNNYIYTSWDGAANDTLALDFEARSWDDNTKLSAVVLDFGSAGNVNIFDVVGDGVQVYATDSATQTGGPVSKNGDGYYLTMRRYVIISHVSSDATSVSIRLHELHFSLDTINYSLHAIFGGNASTESISTGTLEAPGGNPYSLAIDPPRIVDGHYPLYLTIKEAVANSATGKFTIISGTDGVTYFKPEGTLTFDSGITNSNDLIPHETGPKVLGGNYPVYDTHHTSNAESSNGGGPGTSTRVVIADENGANRMYYVPNGVKYQVWTNGDYAENGPLVVNTDGTVNASTGTYPLYQSKIAAENVVWGNGQVQEFEYGGVIYYMPSGTDVTTFTGNTYSNENTLVVDGVTVRYSDPLNVSGYYPLFLTEAHANAYGDGTIKESLTLDFVNPSTGASQTTFFVPNGVTSWSGDYDPSLSDTEKLVVSGYYPVFKTRISAENESIDGTVDIHVISGVNYFMPANTLYTRFTGDLGVLQTSKEIISTEESFDLTETSSVNDSLASISIGENYIAVGNLTNRDAISIYDMDLNFLYEIDESYNSTSAFGATVRFIPGTDTLLVSEHLYQSGYYGRLYKYDLSGGTQAAALASSDYYRDTNNSRYRWFGVNFSISETGKYAICSGTYYYSHHVVIDLETMDQTGSNNKGLRYDYVGSGSGISEERNLFVIGDYKLDYYQNGKVYFYDLSSPSTLLGTSDSHSTKYARLGAGPMYFKGKYLFCFHEDYITVIDSETYKIVDEYDFNGSAIAYTTTYEHNLKLDSSPNDLYSGTLYMGNYQGAAFGQYPPTSHSVGYQVNGGGSIQSYPWSFDVETETLTVGAQACGNVNTNAARDCNKTINQFFTSDINSGDAFGRETSWDISADRSTVYAINHKGKLFKYSYNAVNEMPIAKDGYYPLYEVEHISDKFSDDGTSTLLQVGDGYYFYPNATTYQTWLPNDNSTYNENSETGPKSVAGYYPLYDTIIGAVGASKNGFYGLFPKTTDVTEVSLGGTTYYQPTGVSTWSGDYDEGGVYVPNAVQMGSGSNDLSPAQLFNAHPSHLFGGIIDGVGQGVSFTPLTINSQLVIVDFESQGGTSHGVTLNYGLPNEVVIPGTPFSGKSDLTVTQYLTLPYVLENITFTSSHASSQFISHLKIDGKHVDAVLQAGSYASEVYSTPPSAAAVAASLPQSIEGYYPIYRTVGAAVAESEVYNPGSGSASAHLVSGVLMFQPDNVPYTTWQGNYSDNVALGVEGYYPVYKSSIKAIELSEKYGDGSHPEGTFVMYELSGVQYFMPGNVTFTTWTGDYDVNTVDQSPLNVQSSSLYVPNVSFTSGDSMSDGQGVTDAGMFTNDKRTAFKAPGTVSFNAIPVTSNIWIRAFGNATDAGLTYVINGSDTGVQATNGTAKIPYAGSVTSIGLAGATTGKSIHIWDISVDHEYEHEHNSSLITVTTLITNPNAGYYPMFQTSVAAEAYGWGGAELVMIGDTAYFYPKGGRKIWLGNYNPETSDSVAMTKEGYYPLYYTSAGAGSSHLELAFKDGYYYLKQDGTEFYGTKDRYSISTIFDRNNIKEIFSRFHSDEFGTYPKSLAIGGGRIMQPRGSQDDGVQLFDYDGRYMYSVVGPSNEPMPTDPDGPVINGNASGVDYFGYNVAIWGDYAIASSHNEDDDGGAQAGAVYVWGLYTPPLGFNEKNVPGRALHTPGMAQDMRRLVSPDAKKEGMRFGFRIAAGDGLLLVSSISSYEWGEGKKGIVYVFDIETLEYKFSIKNYDPYNTDFGFSMAAGHGLIAIGHGTSNRWGHVYIYDHSGNLVIRLEAPTDKWRTYDDFGYSVKFTPEYLVVGANRSSQRASDHGVVYYFKISDIKSGLYRSSVTGSSSYGNQEPGSNGIVPTDTSKSVFPTSKVGYWGPHNRSNSYGYRAHYAHGYLFNAAPYYDYDMNGAYNSDCGGLWAYDLGQWDRDERPSSAVNTDSASYSEREMSTDGHYGFFALDATADGDGYLGWNLEIDDNIMVINAPRVAQGATNYIGVTFIFKLAPGSGDGDITSDATISEVLAGGDSTNISGMTLDPYPQIGALLHSANSRPSTISPTLSTLTSAHSPQSSTFESVPAPKYDNRGYAFTTLYKDNDSSQDIGLTAPRSSSWLNYVASTKLPDGASYVEMTFTGLTRFMAGVSNGNDLRFSYTGSTSPITGMDGRVGRYEISQGTSTVREVTSGADIAADGTVIGFLMNKDNNTITFYINGTQIHVANMDLSSADCVFGFSCVNTDAATVNFGATPFVHQPNLQIERLPALAQGDGVVDGITSSVTFTVGSNEQKSIIFNTRSTKQTSTNSAGATTFEVTGGTPMSVDKATIGYLDWASFSGSGPAYSTIHDKYMRFAFNPGTYTITLTSQSSQEILVPYMIFDEPYGKVNSPDAIYDGYLTSPGRIKLIDDAQHKAIADGPVGETWVQISTQFTEKIGDIVNCGNGVLIATGKEAGPLPDHTSYHKLVNTQSRKLYRSDDYGSTWTVSDPALPFEVQNPSATNAGRLRMATGYHAIEHLGNGVILVGVGSDGVDDQVGEFSPYLLRSTDYGLTWTKFDPLLDYSRAAGYGDRHTHDSTVQVKMSHGENQFAFRCIRNIGNGVAIASTGHEVYENTTTYQSSAWRTTDYGATWTYINYGFGGVITFISKKLSNDAIYACVNKKTKFDVYKSTDDGDTWTLVSDFETTGTKTDINDIYAKTCVWSIEELSNGSVLVGFGGRELEIGAASGHFMMSTVVSFPSLADMEALTNGTEGKWNHENGNQYTPLGAQGAYGIDLCQATDIPGLVFASTYAQSYDGQGDAMIFKSGNYGLTWRNIDDLSYDFNTSGYHKPTYIGNGRLVVGGSGGGRKYVGYANNTHSSSQMFAQSGKMGKIYISDVSLVPTSTVPLFNTTTYTGTSASQKLTTGVDLLGSGGLFWLKGRNTDGDHWLYDSERGPSSHLRIGTDEASNYGDSYNVDFENDGVTLGSNGSINYTGKNYVGWSFVKAAGFLDIVKYTGDGTGFNNQTIAHGLGEVPGMIIIKELNGSSWWPVFHKDLPSPQVSMLNRPNGVMNHGGYYASNPTATTFEVGNHVYINEENDEYIAYLFADNPDNQIKCGSYVGNGTGGMLHTVGFKPHWLMIKKATDSGDWAIIDSTRGNFSELYPNNNNVEGTGNILIDFNPNGFYVDSVSGGGDWDASGETYIYVAIGSPTGTIFDTSSSVPVETDPRSVVIDLGEGNLVKTGDNLILEFSAPVSEANGMEGRMSFYDKDGIEIKAGPHSDATTEIFIKNSVGGTIVDYDPKFMAMDNSGALYRPRPDETVTTSNKNYPYHKSGNQTNLGTFSKNTGTLITGLSDPKHIVDGNLVTYHEQTLPTGGAENQGIYNNEYAYESQAAMTWIEFGTPIPVTSDNISLWLANASVGDNPGNHNGQFNLYIEYSDGTDYTAFLSLVSSPIETFRHIPAKYDVTDAGATGKSISKLSLFNASSMYSGQYRLFGIQFGDSLVGTPTSAEPDSSYGPAILNDHVMRLEIEKTLRGVRYIKMPVISAQSIRRISNRRM